MPLTVNGHEITEEQIQQEMGVMRQRYQAYMAQHQAQAKDDELKEWVKESLIERALIEQEAERTIKDVPAADIDAAYKEAQSQFGKLPEEEARLIVTRQLRTQRLVDSIRDKIKQPSDKDVSDFYKQNEQHFVMPEQVHVRHIEKKIPAPDQKDAIYVEALNIHEELKKGASFEDLCDKHSDCPNSDLGYFAKGAMVEEFDDVVFNMKPGEVSDVFLTDFGYHIAKVYDRKDNATVPLEEAKDRIIEQLTMEAQTTALNSFVDELKAKAAIDRS